MIGFMMFATVVSDATIMMHARRCGLPPAKVELHADADGGRLVGLIPDNDSVRVRSIVCFERWADRNGVRHTLDFIPEEMLPPPAPNLKGRRSR
jgi:hypothetical protein